MLKYNLTCATVLLAAACAGSAPKNPVLDAQLERARRMKSVNRARVAAEAKGDLVWYVVPAMSDRMRLMDTYPEDGRLGGDLRIVMAQGSFEAASFQLFSFRDCPSTTLEVSDLTGPDGATISKADIDMRVVKLWLQNGNGWISFFQDGGLKLVPELLLHDENLIRVDLEKQANYARLKDESGERFVWISAPAELDANRFDPMNEAFADALTLQPVRLEKDEFKQFWLTVHARRNCRPGLYRGTVSIRRSSNPGDRAFLIPLKVRILPFALPEPRQFWNPKELFVSSIIDFMKFDKLLQLVNGDRVRAKRLYRDYLIQMRDHGVFYPVVQADRENYDLLREVGLPTSPVWQARSFAPWVMCNRLTFDDQMGMRDGARTCRAFYRDVAGSDDIYAMYGDEEPASLTFIHRRVAEIYREEGIKIGCAGTDPILYKAGYVYAMNPRGAPPEDASVTRAWREIGGNLQAFYANQHNGSENPQFVRTQHGLAQWMAGFEMLYNYEFAQGPWNDLGSGAYKPMVVSYLSSTGLVDTLAWNGYREGVDDIRYGTLIKLLTAEAERADNVPAFLEGKKALQYLALLPRTGWDPNAVRAELIERILRVRKLLGKEDK